MIAESAIADDFSIAGDDLDNISHADLVTISTITARGKVILRMGIRCIEVYRSHSTPCAVTNLLSKKQNLTKILDKLNEIDTTCM